MPRAPSGGGYGGGIFFGGRNILNGVLNVNRPTGAQADGGAAASLTIDGCQFLNNSALSADSSDPTVMTKDSYAAGAGVMALGAVSLRVANSELRSNIADRRAGAIGTACELWRGAPCPEEPALRPRLEVVNCTIALNDAEEGGGILARGRWAPHCTSCRAWVGEVACSHADLCCSVVAHVQQAPAQRRVTPPPRRQ